MRRTVLERQTGGRERRRDGEKEEGKWQHLSRMQERRKREECREREIEKQRDLLELSQGRYSGYREVQS